LGLLTAVTGFSLLWALPSGIHLGVATVLYGVVFLLWLREVIVVARDDPGMLDTVILWAIPGVAVQSVLTIIFRVSPAIEERFLDSGLAPVTVGPAAEHSYADVAGNVIDPNKSGGLFVNGNVASLFGGVAALLLCVAARRTMHRWIYVFAALSLAGSVFTGSKSALAIGTGCALVILFLPRIRKVSAVLAAVSIVLVMPVAFSALTGVVDRLAPTFYAATGSSYGTREQLWTRAAQMFQESPVLGPGFGGWIERVGRVGSRADLPPHNILIATWAYSGIVAAVLAIVFMVAAIAFGLRVAAAQPTIRDRRTAVFALYAIAWVFLHGMGDNTTLYIDRHGMILVAVAFGYLYAMQQESVGFVSDETQGTATTSAEMPGTHRYRRHRGHAQSGGRRAGRTPLRNARKDLVVRVAPAKQRARSRRLHERLDVEIPNFGEPNSRLHNRPRRQQERRVLAAVGLETAKSTTASSIKPS
jgi:O-antigen ligase